MQQVPCETGCTEVAGDCTLNEFFCWRLLSKSPKDDKNDDNIQLVAVLESGNTKSLYNID
jgi:hypothetical protein